MKKTNQAKMMNMEPLLENLEMNYPYKVVKKLGEGVNGTVYQVVHKSVHADRKMAMKLILNPFENGEKARQVYREIKILNRLSEFKNNIFTPNIYDIILPEEAIKTKVTKAQAEYMAEDDQYLTEEYHDAPKVK